MTDNLYSAQPEKNRFTQVMSLGNVKTYVRTKNKANLTYFNFFSRQ